MRVSINRAGLVAEIKKASKVEKKSPESEKLAGFWKYSPDFAFFWLKIARIWPDLLESKLDLAGSP